LFNAVLLKPKACADFVWGFANVHSLFNATVHESVI
jgi:hypothetical protein